MVNSLDNVIIIIAITIIIPNTSITVTISETRTKIHGSFMVCPVYIMFTDTGNIHNNTTMLLK